MSGNVNSALMGAIAMASAVATLFFLRFFKQTRDSFFLLFAVAFGIDAASRLIMATSQIASETEPFYYLARLVTFGLILVAIVQKNR
jgi:hypothetical protein